LDEFLESVGVYWYMLSFFFRLFLLSVILGNPALDSA
jgi:hypothetical protein